jgi:hypothetical protein
MLRQEAAAHSSFPPWPTPGRRKRSRRNFVFVRRLCGAIMAPRAMPKIRRRELPPVRQ